MPVVNPDEPWRLLIKAMGGVTGPPGPMQITFNATTKLWSRTAAGIISYPSTVNHAAGGPYVVTQAITKYDPINKTGVTFYELKTGPNVGFLVSNWTNSLGYGDITVAKASNFDRGPGAVLLTLEQPAAHLCGASLNWNAAGEMHFTMLVDDPNILIPVPKQTHYAIEFFRGGVWKEVFAGMIWDMDATDTEVVFKGEDYLGLYRFCFDERFNLKNPKQPPPLGCFYSKQTISSIITQQLNYSRDQPDSIVSFIGVGSINAGTQITTVWSAAVNTLTFCLGLINSARAGTGKQTRIQVVKTTGGTYQVVVDNDPGVERPDLLLEYAPGGLVQGYHIIKFGANWADRVYMIGKAADNTTSYIAAQDAATDQVQWGRIEQAATVVEGIYDISDLRRRALQAAVDASRLGKQVSVGLKVGSFAPLEDWDLCDLVPVSIVHGAVNTNEWGGGNLAETDPTVDPGKMSAGLWQILGMVWESYDDGHWMTALNLLPKGSGTIVDKDWRFLVDPNNDTKGATAQDGWFDLLGSSDGVTYHVVCAAGFDFNTTACSAPGYIVSMPDIYLKYWRIRFRYELDTTDFRYFGGRSIPQAHLFNSAGVDVWDSVPMLEHTISNPGGSLDTNYFEPNVGNWVGCGGLAWGTGGDPRGWFTPREGAFGIKGAVTCGNSGPVPAFFEFHWDLFAPNIAADPMVGGPTQIPMPPVASGNGPPNSQTPSTGTYTDIASGINYTLDPNTSAWVAVPGTGNLASGLFDFTFASSTTWVVNHTLDGYPRVTARDVTGAVIDCPVVYNSVSQITLTFSSAVAGSVHLG